MRTTISIPNDLKKEMEKHTGINWSALAAKAFAQAISFPLRLSIEDRIARIEKILKIKN